MKTWTLSTNVTPDVMETACIDLGIPKLGVSWTGWYPGGVAVSIMTETDGPPADLERLRKHLVARGDNARYY